MPYISNTGFDTHKIRHHDWRCMYLLCGLQPVVSRTFCYYCVTVTQAVSHWNSETWECGGGPLVSSLVGTVHLVGTVRARVRETRRPERGLGGSYALTRARSCVFIRLRIVACLWWILVERFCLFHRASRVFTALFVHAVPLAVCTDCTRTSAGTGRYYRRRFM